MLFSCESFRDILATGDLLGVWLLLLFREDAAAVPKIGTSSFSSSSSSSSTEDASAESRRSCVFFRKRLVSSWMRERISSLSTPMVSIGSGLLSTAVVLFLVSLLLDI